MNNEDLERARAKVLAQTKATNRRVTIAQRVKQWYEDQADQNGFREMIDALIRGQE